MRVGQVLLGLAKDKISRWDLDMIKQAAIQGIIVEGLVGVEVVGGEDGN